MLSRQQIIRRVESTRWVYGYDRRMTFQKAQFFSRDFAVNLPKEFGISFGLTIDRYKNGIASHYFAQNNLLTALSHIERFFLHKDSTPKTYSLAAKIPSVYNTFDAFVNSMPASYSSYSNKRLMAAYARYIKEESKISLVSWLLFLPLDKAIANALQKTLLRVGFSDVSSIIEGLSQPYLVTPGDEMLMASYSLAISSPDKKGKLLKKMQRKYSYIGMYDVDYVSPGFDDYSEKSAKISPVKASELLLKLKKDYASRARKVRKILSEWKHDMHIHSLLTLFVQYANYKELKPAYREKSSYKLRLLLQEISSRLSLTLEQTAFLTYDEVLDGLSGKPIPKSHDIDLRSSNSALIFDRIEPYIFIDDKSLRAIDAVLPVDSALEVKGRSVYPGLVKGKVQIIASNKDFHKFSNGDVLVSSTTRPDYLPIMKKAAAIITNEGGILCHAAIQSRELKVPCVVGTKIATRIFKDGDLVEVDATRGIIRKISG